MDLSKLSNEDLIAISEGRISNVSNAGIKLISGQQTAQPKQETSFVQDLMRGFRDPIDAAAQLLPRVLEVVTSAGGTVPNEVSQWFGKEAKRVDALNKSVEQQYRAAGGEDLTAGRVIGNIVNPASVVPALRAGQLVGRGVQVAGVPIRGAGMGPAAQAAAVGTTGGVLTPVQDTENFAETKALQAGLGAVLGPVTEKVAGVVSPRITEGAQRLREAGVRNLTPGQAFGGIPQRLEQAAESIPLVGDIVAGARTRNIEEFSRAAINQSLQNIDKQLPKGLSGNAAISFAEKEIGKQYDKLVPKLSVSSNTLLNVADEAPLTLMTSINNIISDAAQNLDDKAASQLNKIIENNLTKKFKNETLAGKDLKTAESVLGNFAVKFKKAQDPNQNLIGDALFDVQLALRDGVEKANPEFAGQLQKINSAFADFIRVQRAAASTGAKEGVFTPAQLSAAAKATDISKRKGAFARGEARMQDIAQAGEQVLGSRIPDSGTPYRLGVGAAGLGAMGAIDPYTALLGAGPMAAYTQPGLRMISPLLYERPELLRRIGEPLRQAAPFAVPGLLSPFQE
jgi:hypothetical protein